MRLARTVAPRPDLYFPIRADLLQLAGTGVLELRKSAKDGNRDRPAPL